MRNWIEDVIRAFEQIAKAEIKIVLVVVCGFLLMVPVAIFFSMVTSNVDVELEVDGCKPTLVADMQGWIAEQQRSGVTATVSPLPGSGAMVSGTPAKYELHYLSSDFMRVWAAPVPEPFVQNCRINAYRTSEMRDASPVAARLVSALLPFYASILVLVPWSLRARGENLVPGIALVQAIQAIPRWCGPLGLLTMVTAATLVILAQQVSIDISSVRDSGAMFGDLVRNNPWLAAIVLGLAAPVFEELLFRRWLLDGFLRAGMPVFGSLVVSANFSLLHLTNFGLTNAFVAGFTLYFLISIVLCWVYVRTRNVLACMVVHMVHNCSSALAMSWLGGS
jgi:membrane protease YdiL (CAAX protease family)